MKKIPKKFIKSHYRKEMWANAQKVIKKIEKVLPISSVHILGSFTTNKRRPADMDFFVMLGTKGNRDENWAVDMQIVPDNQHGKESLEDLTKWMKQRYGSKKSAVIKLK